MKKDLLLLVRAVCLVVVIRDEGRTDVYANIILMAT